jgi:hypothetical protein
VPTCSKHLPDEAAEELRRFEESKKLSKSPLSGKGKTKREETSHAQEQKNRRVPRNQADCLPPDTMSLSTLSAEELETLENSLKKELMKIMEENLISSGDDQKEKHITRKPKALRTPKSQNDILLEEMIVAFRRKIATQEQMVIPQMQEPLVEQKATRFLKKW